MKYKLLWRTMPLWHPHFYPVGQTTGKRQAANSPSTLKSSTTSLPNRDAFQRQCLVSAQKSLTNTFEYASIPSHFAAPALYQPHVVCCEGIVCRELYHVVNSSSAEVLKYLHACCQRKGVLPRLLCKGGGCLHRRKLKTGSGLMVSWFAHLVSNSKATSPVKWRSLLSFKVNTTRHRHQ